MTTPNEAVAREVRKRVSKSTDREGLIASYAAMENAARRQAEIAALASPRKEEAAGEGAQHVARTLGNAIANQGFAKTATPADKTPCPCACHRGSGIMHVMPCCDDGFVATPDTVGSSGGDAIGERPGEPLGFLLKRLEYEERILSVEMEIERLKLEIAASKSKPFEPFWENPDGPTAA